MPTRHQPGSTSAAHSLRTLLAGIVDYAGLYPPAGLAMQPAVEDYARALRGGHAWMLGRFVCPASLLDEFSTAAAPFMPGTFATSGYREHADATEPWRVSVIVDGPLGQAVEAISCFNARHTQADRGQAIADALEMKPPGGAVVEETLDAIPDEVFPFFEAPGLTPQEQGDPRGLIAALAGGGAGAKIRTGGLTAAAFPTAAQVAGFIVACHAAEVPFKATAGLHHPVRAEHALTYEPEAARAVMHGFLNVFMAAALVHGAGADAAAAQAVIEETDPAAFQFNETEASWRSRAVSAGALAAARERFALSFGSCSFEEPVDDLRRLGLLPG